MTLNERKAWVKSLKVGDRVILRRGNRLDDQITTVVSVTRRRPTTKGGLPWDQYGEGGESFHHRSIEPLTPDDEARITRSETRRCRIGRIRGLDTLDYEKVTDDQLARIIAILDGRASEAPAPLAGRAAIGKPTACSECSDRTMPLNDAKHCPECAASLAEADAVEMRSRHRDDEAQ